MATTNNGRIAYVEETLLGSTPSDPEFSTLRVVSSNMAYNKQTAESNEVSVKNSISALVHVGAEIGGALDIEWSPVTYNDFIAAGIRGLKTNVVSVTAGSASIAVSGGVATVTDTVSSGFANAVEGQWLLFRNWSNRSNNGWKLVSSSDGSSTITIQDPNMVDEAAGSQGNIQGTMIRNGVEETSFSFEESFTDIDVFRLFKGQRVNTLSADFSAGSLITGSVGFVGTGVEIEHGSPPSWLGGGSRASASTTRVMDTTANVGDIFINGVVSSTCFKQLTLNVDNRLRSTLCIGSELPSRVGYGRQQVSGTLVKVFNSTALYEAMLNHSNVSLAFGSYNSDGGMHFSLPRIKFRSNNVSLSGGNNSDVDEVVEWTAIKDVTGTYQIQIDVATAAPLTAAPWILADGTWNDAGTWQDAESWVESEICADFTQCSTTLTT